MIYTACASHRARPLTLPGPCAGPLPPALLLAHPQCFCTAHDGDQALGTALQTPPQQAPRRLAASAPPPLPPGTQPQRTALPGHTPRPSPPLCPSA